VGEPIYAKLLNHTPEGYYLVADSGFPLVFGEKIRKPITAGTTLEGTQAEIDEDIAEDRQLLSARQAAEWGMRTVQGSFGRLRLPLPVGSNKQRGEILETCFRLANIRASCVGISQIRTVYTKMWEDRDDDQFWDGVTESIYGSLFGRNNRVSRFRLNVEEI
jgi:hypothetical protein